MSKCSTGYRIQPIRIIPFISIVCQSLTDFLCSIEIKRLAKLGKRHIPGIIGSRTRLALAVFVVIKITPLAPRVP